MLITIHLVAAAVNKLLAQVTGNEELKTKRRGLLVFVEICRNFIDRSESNWM
jgi:hypothetical protein